MTHKGLQVLRNLITTVSRLTPLFSSMRKLLKLGFQTSISLSFLKASSILFSRIDLRIASCFRFSTMTRNSGVLEAISSNRDSETYSQSFFKTHAHLIISSSRIIRSLRTIFVKESNQMTVSIQRSEIEQQQLCFLMREYRSYMDIVDVDCVGRITWGRVHELI